MTSSEFVSIFKAFGYSSMTIDGLTPLKCLSCGSPLSIELDELKCDNFHSFKFIDFTINYFELIEVYKTDIINGTLDLGKNEDDTLPIILEACDV